MPATLHCYLRIDFVAGTIPGTLGFIVSGVNEQNESLAAIHSGTARVGLSVHLGPLSIPLDLVAGDGPPPIPALGAGLNTPPLDPRFRGS